MGWRCPPYVREGERDRKRGERGEGELITIHARSTFGVGGDFITFRSALRLAEAAGLAVPAHFRFRMADLRLRYAYPKSGTKNVTPFEFTRRLGIF